METDAMSGARILIVEDEAIEAMDIQQRLASLGYPTPDIAHSGEEGVRKAEEISPDLILMDIMLPGKIDGVMAAERIRSRLDVPIIYLTAYADEKTLQRAKITEPYGYIVKPFQEKELHVSVDVALYKHQMERKLRESEKWLSTTLSSIGDAVIAADKDGLVTFMNPVAEALTGWKLGEAMSKKLTEVFRIVNRDTRRPTEDPVARVIREGTVVGLANHTLLVARNGAEMPIDDSAAPIKGDRGDLIGVVLVFRDVTEREKTEQLKDEFIGMVSHELKTPLTVVIGAIHTAMTAGLAQEQAHELLQDALNGAEELTGIVENLLELSRSQANRLELRTEPADISRIAREVTLKLQGRSSIHKLATALPAGLPAISVDPIRVERVLYNLVENAIKYSPKGGEIRIFARQKDSSLVVGVSDQGPGISEDNQKRLFQSFEQLGTDRRLAMQGVGLGLKVCRTLVEAHGGRIWVESEPGKGATFLFSMPAAKRPMAGSTENVEVPLTKVDPRGS